MAEQQTQIQQNNDIIDISEIRPITVWDMEELSPYIYFQPQQKTPTQEELEQFKNDSITARLFKHLASGATINFYNPYKIDPDTAEKEGDWFYKRLIRIPIIEDFISPYGFSMAGLTEFLPLLASGGAIGALARVAGIERGLGVISGAEKVLSSGIRGLEKVGPTLVEGVSKYTASKIPAIEKAWLSINPAVRNLGYGFIKKDLELAPWVGGISYREKQLQQEDASRIKEYFNALVNPTNLLFSSIGAGLEARALSKQMASLGSKGFWDGLKDYQMLQDLRSPSIQKNISELIKKSAIENSPLNSKLLIDYIDTAKKINGGQYDSLLSLLEKDENGKYIVSQKIRNILQKDSVAGLNKELNKAFSGLDVLFAKTFENPSVLIEKLPAYIERLVSEDVLSKNVGSSIISDIGKINDSLNLMQNNFVRFFDNIVNDNGIRSILESNDFVAGLLKGKDIKSITPEQKMSILNMLFKSDAFSSVLKDIKPIQKAFEELTNNSIVVSDKLLGLMKKIENMPESIASKLKSYLLEDIKSEIKYNPYAIIPTEIQSQIISDNIVLPSFFIKDVLESVAQKTNTLIKNPEYVGKLFRNGQLTNYLRDQLDADSFLNLASKYPEYFNLTPEEQLQIQKLKNLSEIDSSIKEKTKNENVSKQVIKQIKNTQHIGLQGIDKPRDVKLTEDINFLVKNPYEMLKSIDEFNKLDSQTKDIAKDLFHVKIMLDDRTLNIANRESLGSVEKFEFVQNVLSGKMNNNPRLYVSKTLLNAIEYLTDFGTDLGKEQKQKAIQDLVDYYLGKKEKK